MTVKDRLLKTLEEHPGEYLSGEQLAEELGCTRGAVWKAVEGLRARGWQIKAATNRGYMLEGSDVLSLEGISSALKTRGLELKVFGSLGSTNTELRRLAEEGAPEGTVVIAGMQTAGKGRMGRSFFSPSDTGLYLSLLLRPKLAAEEAVSLTTAAAVAVAGAIGDVTGKRADIKWVNDVYLEGRKVCGILTEAVFGMELGGLEYAVLGIGVNVYTPEGGFPEELRDIAGAVAGERETSLRNRLAAAILDRFMDFYRCLPGHPWLQEYRDRLLWRGEEIRVIRGSESFTAILEGVDDQLALIVSAPDGRHRLTSGEISIRRAGV